MKTYLALLRGINVGGNNKVSMNALQKVFATLAYKDVQTYINSGNVIFKTDKEPNQDLIEKTLLETFGFKIDIVIRDANALQKICGKTSQEWKNDAEERTDVLFLREGFAKKESITLLKPTEVDNLLYIEGAIVWNLKKKDLARSGMRKFIGTELYKNMTARNINTVRKLHELMS